MMAEEEIINASGSEVQIEFTRCCMEYNNAYNKYVGAAGPLASAAVVQSQNIQKPNDFAVRYVTDIRLTEIENDITDEGNKRREKIIATSRYYARLQREILCPSLLSVSGAEPAAP